MKNINCIRTLFCLAAALMLFCHSAARAENIDPNDVGSQYAYGENIGWLNFEPSLGPGVTVTDTAVTGFVWQENIGWINLGPMPYGGVTINGDRRLGGWAWGENVGWINFSCLNTDSCATVDYGVTINADGKFDGYAWGENIGWINFALVSQPDYQVQTSWESTTIGTVETDNTWLLIAPDGDRSKEPINNVGLSWEASNTGWNTNFTYGTSSWGTPVSYGDIWGHGYSAYWAPDHASPCYLRKIVNLPAVQQAFLSGGADDDIQIYINGTLVFDDHNGTAAGFGPIDVTAYLVPGSNLIAAKAHDSSGGNDGYYFKIAWTAPPTTTTVQPTTTIQPTTTVQPTTTTTTVRPTTTTTTVSCTYSISPTSKTFKVSGGKATVSVSTQNGCAWTATSNDPSWITITSGATGAGNGGVKYSVAKNPSTISRTGTMVIAGETFTVYQTKTKR